MTQEEQRKRWREHTKKYRLDNPEKTKRDTSNYALKKKYGITLEQQKQMYIAQGGVCAICGNKFKGRKDIHVDHNHAAGTVRQLLCNNCNVGIGYLQDDVSIMLKAEAYLTKWNSK